MTENDSVHEEIHAWKMSFQMTNLVKLFASKMQVDKVTGLFGLGVLLLQFTTLLSGLFHFKYFFCFLSIKGGNIDLTGEISLLLSFPPVSGSKYCECPTMLLVLKTQQGLMTYWSLPKTTGWGCYSTNLDLLIQSKNDYTFAVEQALRLQ